MVLEFLDTLEMICASWIENEKLTFHQLAEKTKTPIPYVLDYINMGLSKNLEVYDLLSSREIDLALNNLRQKMRLEIEAKERRKEEQKVRSQALYHQTMEKVRTRLAQKDYYGAYRTLSYFAGVHVEYLPKPLLVTIANDCLHIGFKSGVNRQELAGWLQKGVRLCLASESNDSVEDAKDFLETYADAFMDNDNRSSFVAALRSMIDRIINPQFMEPISIPDGVTLPAEVMTPSNNVVDVQS